MGLKFLLTELGGFEGKFTVDNWELNSKNCLVLPADADVSQSHLKKHF